MQDGNDLDLDFSQEMDITRENARLVYRAGFGDPHLAERWERICQDIRFEDVVSEVHGTHSPVISCPFHGRDSRPSFHLYRRTNDAFCFGCPPGEGLYDAVKFVAAKFGYTRTQAIVWLEKQFDLPPLEVEEDEADDDTPTTEVSLNFTHLSGPFIAKAAAAFLESGNPEIARAYIAIFFAAVPDRNADASDPAQIEKAMPLARVLGWRAIERLKKERLMS